MLEPDRSAREHRLRFERPETNLQPRRSDGSKLQSGFQPLPVTFATQLLILRSIGAVPREFIDEKINELPLRYQEPLCDPAAVGSRIAMTGDHVFNHESTPFPARRNLADRHHSARQQKPRMPLHTAIRRVIVCRPPAKHVEIHVEGENLMEDEIKPLYALISLPI
ncbi:hypothetical protein H9Q09_10185 [Aurantimonas sp. DM33-3]|uniref:hypothetical protein n=1 Tax=Aurantimonas sp. DM33-3 TaxID=2766955 RepID=UPI0016525F9C|nr:hypothetical protein [Aurantimonas sp. DM33-3]MBC6716574.1 hypothetical protein [Aurantimonas sp. DM33-3]